MWWVPTTEGCWASREVQSPEPPLGSSAKTSSPARTVPASSAASSASSSTTSPREVLSRIAPGFIRARKPASTSPRVSGLTGTCRLTTSELASNASSDSHIAMPSSSALATTWSARPVLARDCTCIPNATARSATASPIDPRPMTPIVESRTPAALL